MQEIFNASYILPTPFLKPIKPGLSKDKFIKTLEDKIYEEIEKIS